MNHFQFGFEQQVPLHYAALQAMHGLIMSPFVGPEMNHLLWAPEIQHLHWMAQNSVRLLNQSSQFSCSQNASESDPKLLVLSQQKRKDTNIGDASQEVRGSMQESKQSKFKQKEGRNMVSNIFRQGVKHILTYRQRTLEHIERINQLKHLEVDGKEFLEQLSKKAKTFKNYVRLFHIQQMLKGKDSQKSKEFSLVLRILLSHYLKTEVFSSLCSNPKIKKPNRDIHIKQRRTLQQMLMKK